MLSQRLRGGALMVEPAERRESGLDGDHAFRTNAFREWLRAKRRFRLSPHVCGGSVAESPEATKAAAWTIQPEEDSTATCSTAPDDPDSGGAARPVRVRFPSSITSAWAIEPMPPTSPGRRGEGGSGDEPRCGRAERQGGSGHDRLRAFRWRNRLPSPTRLPSGAPLGRRAPADRRDLVVRREIAKRAARSRWKGRNTKGGTIRLRPSMLLGRF